MAHLKATSAQNLALATSPALTDNLFRQFMQAYIEDRCQPALALAQVKPWKDSSDRSSKARNPDLCYNILHMECYYFCQQY